MEVLSDECSSVKSELVLSEIVLGKLEAFTKLFHVHRHAQRLESGSNKTLLGQIHFLS